MKFDLKDYQTDIVDEALSEIDTGFARYANGERRTAVGIAAPTGGGDCGADRCREDGGGCGPD